MRTNSVRRLKTTCSCENRCPTQHLVPSRLRATLHIDYWSIPMPTATPIFHSWGCPELGAWASLTSTTRESPYGRRVSRYLSPPPRLRPASSQKSAQPLGLGRSRRSPDYGVSRELVQNSKSSFSGIATMRVSGFYIRLLGTYAPVL